MNRRKLLSGGVALAAAGPILAGEPVRYPNADQVRLDPMFRGFIGNTPISRLFTNPDM